MRCTFQWLVKVLVISTLIATVIITDTCAEGLTKEQGDAILNELRQIRTLLVRQQLPFAPQIPPPSVKVMLKLGTDYTLGR